LTRPTTTKKFALIALGSYGDVHPFIGLAIALQKRGHDVVLMANPRFEPIIRREHIAFIAVGTLEQYEKSIRNPDLWNPAQRCTRDLRNRIVGTGRGVQPGCRLCELESWRDGRRVQSGSRGALCSRQTRLSDGHGPSRTGSVSQFPGSAENSGALVPSWLPLWARRAVWAIGDRFFMDPLIAPRLNAFRAAHGLAPVKRVLDQWWNSPDRIIGLFPSWFANNPGDWWPQTRVTGFPLYDERNVERISPDLETFLNAGPRPIAVTLAAR
jgi:rhamnosyltransferase subunit B